MSFKSRMGLDVIDFGIQALLTVLLSAWAVNTSNEADGQVWVFVLTTSSLVTFAVRRRFALKKAEEPRGLTTGEMAAERLAEVESRLAEVDFLQAQVAELTERLDFAERLLAQQREPAALPKGDV